jgi:subtilisin family serine protease
MFFSMGFSNQPGSQAIIHRGNLYYLAHTVVVKLKNQSTGGLSKAQNVTAQLNNKLSKFKFSSAKALFGTGTSAEAAKLNNIMLVKFDAQDDPLSVAKKIKETSSDIEWAEPKYVRKIVSTVNDPSRNSQYYLDLINANGAWSISTGDASVIIAIVDCGVDWSHPDLYANIWHNPNPSSVNHDTIGWDFGGSTGTADNNPIEDYPAHGTLVAGVASAVTNNGVGVAGVGYNCKIMPVKVSEGDNYNVTRDEPYIVYGYEGIKYAADNGAKVINCSWGSAGYSNAEQEVIDYAIAKGALVIAAAGNDGSSEKFYPAGYAGVLSVAATDANDNVTNWSNYGPEVKVAAPGSNIYSTWQPNTYTSGDGTSFSSPMVAGLAALVTSHFPAYAPLQVAEQIRVNCDNIDAKNPAYKYQVGRGRINAYNAINNSNSISVRAVGIEASDSTTGGNSNGIFEPGETISLSVRFVNYLQPVQNLTVSLVSLNPYATVQNASINKSSMGTLETDNSDSKFSFTLASTLPYDTTLQFILQYSDGSGYSDFQLIDIPVNPSYNTQSGNNVSLTITSKGALGYNDYPGNLLGNGFRFKNGNNFLFEGALMYGTSSTTIEDAARNGTDGNTQDNSFAMVQPFNLQIPGDLTYERGITIFNDNNDTSKLGITTRLDSYTFTSSPDNNYIILKYSFINNSQSSISNFYAGVYFDWDMVDGSGDSAAYDAQGHLGYVKHAASAFDTLIATALISSTDYGYWAILNDASDGHFGVYTGFTSAEKWTALSSGTTVKPSAGTGDISEVTSGGPYSILAGDTLKVAFAVAAGNSLDDLRSAISSARSKYQEILTDVSSEKTATPVSYNLSQNYPNPFNPSTTVKYQIAKQSSVTLKIYDILGREIATLVNEEKPAGSYSVSFNASSFSSGIYFYQIKAGGYTAVKKMILLK